MNSNNHSHSSSNDNMSMNNINNNNNNNSNNINASSNISKEDKALGFAPSHSQINNSPMSNIPNSSIGTKPSPFNLNAAIPRKARPLDKIPKKMLKPPTETLLNAHATSTTNYNDNYHHKNVHHYDKTKSSHVVHKLPKKRDKLSFGHHSSSSISSPSSQSQNTHYGQERGELETNSISIKSESPLIIAIDCKHLPKECLMPSIHKRQRSTSATTTPTTRTKDLSSSTTPSPRLRSSNRSHKRKSYTETKDTDSDFLEDSDSDGNAYNDHQRQLKKKRLVKKTELKNTAHDDGADDEYDDDVMNMDSSNHKYLSRSSPTDVESSNSMVTSAHSQPIDTNNNDVSLPLIAGEDIEAPPSGTIPSLWYSREIFIHVWVIDKIIGWKTRPKVKLEYKDESTSPKLQNDEARLISEKLINHYVPKSKHKRMEISRICPTRCPVVLKAFVEKEARKVKREKNKDNLPLDESELDYKLSGTSSGDDNTDNSHEEVLLIKWRGKSHLHCSWERPLDLELYDTTNNTAKGKIKRYYQSQQMILGKDWKKVMLEGRIASSTTHAHPQPPLDEANRPIGTENDPVEEVEEDDFIQPDFVEIERIMGCDENHVDMKVLSRQRALNIQAENDEENRRCKELIGEDVGRHHEDDTSFLDEEEAWDPEDNVRYVVKWKGLQNSEITWEYWLYIKNDSVDQAEDFWYRQQAPDPEIMKQSVKTHPTMRDYKKLTESPIFGISTRQRPIMSLDNDFAQPRNDEDEADGLRLREYQLEGVNWLLFNWWNMRSCILADEMGLGKTIQSLCFLEQLRVSPAARVYGPFLIVAPLSLVNQWQSECATWAPDLNLILYHGSSNARQFLYENEFYYTEQFTSKTAAQKLKRQHITKFHILITTYEVVMKDLAIFSKIRWKALIVDEAHRLKNHQSRLFSDLGTVPRDFCLLLTGTPLQNSTEELWSLLHFSDPKAFASKDDFVEKFGQLSDSKQVSELHSVLRPYLLRRVKEDVEKSLPPKEETILEVTLTPIQKKYYKAIYERNTSFLFKGSKPNNAPSLMNVMMELRKCCNHPFLIKGAEERIMSEAIEKLKDGKDMDAVTRWHKALTDQLVQSSGKMVILMKLLPKLQEGGHKVLIFSQMVRVLDLLEELLRLNTYRYERLDGSTRASSRHAAVDRFNRKSCRRFVMLLSTRAGGLGLNLTSADTVIIFDSDWNPQNDLQAMARAHRIGQTRAVRVYRLLTAKTYEMHMFHSASMKLGLDRAVLAHQRQNEQDPSQRKKTESEKESQAKEIDQLLKKGAYDIFREDDDSEAKLFMETDIDQLLERSSRTVTYGSTETSISKGLGSFSKASFVTSDADGNDIDLDDPNFWAKAVGFETPDETINENILMDGEKRSRKQVQQFDPYASFVEDEQKKKDKLKEDKKKMKEDQKVKKEEEKDKKKKERDVTKEKGPTDLESSNPSNGEKKDIEAERLILRGKKFKQEMTAKKMRRDEQKEIMRSFALEDPLTDRLKQAWEPSHRDRVINAVLRFGFGRLCKVRNEASLGNVPIQDIEVFLRAYIYQLGVQASISLIQSQSIDNNKFVQHISSIFDSVDGEWVINAMKSAMKIHELIHSEEREVRFPRTLIEPSFLSNLRSGKALSSLHCLAFMSRFNNIMELAIEEIISELGKEELGKRGCYHVDVASLDVDLKARHVTTEELSHTLGRHIIECIDNAQFSNWKGATWWDRSCDLALFIGSFYHGLSNYQAIFADENLPFFRKVAGNKSCLMDIPKSQTTKPDPPDDQEPFIISLSDLDKEINTNNHTPLNNQEDYNSMPSIKSLDDRLYHLVGLIHKSQTEMMMGTHTCEQTRVTETSISSLEMMRIINKCTK